MSAEKYQRDRKRIYVEADGRGLGWKKAALKRLNKEYEAEPIIRSNKIVGMMLHGEEVSCKKKAFETLALAQASLTQIHIIVDSEAAHLKPARAYVCDYCGKFHLTKLINARQPADLELWPEH